MLLGLSTLAHAQDEQEDEDDDAQPSPVVVVEGDALDLADPREAGASVTIVALDDRLPPGSDAADAVARAPGTTVRRLGGLGSFAAVSVRGSALRQVQVHLDGLPLNPDGSSAVDLSAVPLEALRRVEVWRGAAPPELAASPMGGVVNLRTRTDPVPLTLTAQAASFNTLRAGVRGSTLVGGLDVLGGASAWTSRADFVVFDDNNTPSNRIDDRLRTRDNNERRQASGLLRVRGQHDPRWSALVATTAREEGLPGPVGGSPQGRLRTLWAVAGARHAPSARSSMHAWAMVRDELLRPVEGNASRQQQGQVGLHGSGLLWVRPGGLVGLTGQARMDAQHAKDSDNTPTRASATLVAHARWTPSDALVIEPVLHAQGWRDRGFADGSDRLALNPRATARLRLADGWIAHAAAGRAVRPPDFLELFGDRGVVAGRTDLRPERGWWADAGVRWLNDSATIELAGFAHDAIDRIVFVQNTDRTLVPVNTEPSLSAGLEMGAELALGEHLDARLATTWTETRVRGGGSLDGKRLPRIPRLAGTMDVGVRPTPAIRVGATLDAITGNAWDEANLLVAPSRLLLGLDARFTPGGRSPALFLAVRNATNTLAQVGPMDPRYPDGPRVLRPMTDFAGYPLPGRTLMVGLTWSPAAPEPGSP